MSPLWDNEFAGHMFPGDPRSPLFAAGGCVWPTVPGYNLFIGSTTAWGTLAFLNTNGIQLKVHLPSTSHDEGYWTRNGGEGPFTWAWLTKTRRPNLEGFTWHLEFWIPDHGPIPIEWPVPICKCNQSFLIPEVGCPPCIEGGIGTDCRIWQVGWDQTRPYGGWPPPG